jgi:hypothetical protein
MQGSSEMEYRIDVFKEFHRSRLSLRRGCSWDPSIGAKVYNKLTVVEIIGYRLITPLSQSPKEIT